MNKRWITLVGRAGTVLMSAGLALAMLSLIPPRKVENTDFRETLNLPPKTFAFESSFYPSFPLDPQRGFYLNAQANNSVTAYMLNVDRQYVQRWIINHFSDIQPSPTLNVSILEEFLNNHPTSVTWQENAVDRGIELQYAPTRLMNITLIFSNPTTESAKVTYNGKFLNFIVPSERALTPAKFTIPAGLVLTLPWLNSTWKRKTTKLRSSINHIPAQSPKPSDKNPQQSKKSPKTK